MPFPGTTQLQLVFEGGLQSKISKFKLDQPYLLQADDCRYTLDGQVQTRTGLTALSRNIMGGGVISNGAAIQVFGDELVLFDGDTVYSWNPDEKVWVSKGSAFSLTANQVRVINTQIANQANPDAATAGNASGEGLTLYLWEDNRDDPVIAEGIRYSIIDNSTGNVVVSDQLLWTTGERPKSVTFQETNPRDLWFLTYEIDASSIYGSTIRSGRPNIACRPFPIITDGQPSDSGTQTIPYDMSSTVPPGFTQNLVAFAYASTSGIIAMMLIPSFGGYTSFHTQTVQSAEGGEVIADVIATCFTGEGSYWVAWSDDTNTYAQSFQRGGGALSPKITIQAQPSVNIAVSFSPDFDDSLYLVSEVENDAGGNYLNAYLVTAKRVGYLGQQRGVGLASKPFVQGKNVFIQAVYPSSLQATYFTLCLTSPIGTGPNSVSGLVGSTGFEVVAKHSPSNGGGYRTNTLLSECVQYKSTSSFLFAGQRKGPFTSYANAQGVNFGIAGYTIEFSSTNQFNSVASNNNLHITGGVKKIYDGISVVEDNFNVVPELLALPSNAVFPAVASGSIIPPNVAPSSTNLAFAGNGCSVSLSTGGNLTPSSSYLYCVVYAWTDNYGQVQRSGPSVATLVTTTGDGNYTANLKIPTLRLTDKNNPRSPVSVTIYRTQANLQVFRKITNDNDPLVNDPTVDFVTYVDTMADGPPVNSTVPNIAANENIYTDTQLPNIGPPGCSMISLFQNRLVINQDEDPNVLWYSQNKFDLSQYNSLPLDWNTSFVEGVDSRGGTGISAIGLLDASLAIFKKTSIFILGGSGPNALDTQGEFADAQLIISDTGCDNQNSIVQVTQTPNSPGGLLFKSAKGIYLLGRDTGLTYIGAPVEAYNGLTITSANILADTNEIVFTTLEGTCLIYNYFYNAWTTWTNLPAIDAVVWQGQLVILKTDGTCMVQDTTGTVHEDTGSKGIVRPIARAVGTPWVRLGGAIQGYQAVYNCVVLGQYQEPSILKVDVRYDGNPSIIESVLINSNLAGNTWGGLPVWGNPTGTWGNQTFANYQFQINFSNPRCQSVQLTFTDMSNGTAGSTLNGLVFEVLQLPGGPRLPTQNQVATTGYVKGG